MKGPKGTEGEQPWKLIEAEIEESDVAALEEILEVLTASDTARVLSRLSRRDQLRLLQLLPPDEAADVIEDVPEAQAAEIISALPTEDAAAIVGEMPSDHAADVLAELASATTDAILDELPPDEQVDARELLSYGENTAGGVMVKEYLSFDQSLIVADVLRDLEQNAEDYVDFNVQYSYVIDPAGRLIGVLRLRDLVLAKRQTPIASLMIKEPICVQTDANLPELHDFFEDHQFVGLPVVDSGGCSVE